MGSKASVGAVAVELLVNGERRPINVDPETPLLDVLRNDLGLPGAKRGCAQEQCYACAVLVDDIAQPSCQLPVGRIGSSPIVTIESEELDPLREFFEVEQVGQCAFCVSGMIVAAQGLLNRTRWPNDDQIREALDTNLCRCGIYDRVRRAIRFRIGDPEDPIWEVRRPPHLTREPPAKAGPPPVLDQFPTVDSWLAIDEDETITVFSGKAELGQGIATALAGIVADELSVDLHRINMIGPDTSCSPDEGVTSGSLSIETSGAALRAAAQTTRSLLLQAAADKLDVPASSLVIQDGTITSPGSPRQTTYWALKGARPIGAQVEFGTRPPVESDNRHPRIDLTAKLSGRPSYVHDLRIPGTVHGRVVRPPNHGARLRSVDPEEAEAMAGVVAVVVDGSFLGVVAEREEQADAAAVVLAGATRWSETEPRPDPYQQLQSGSTADYSVIDGIPVDGSLESPLPPSAGRFDHTATYRKPFTLHGALGPSAAVARYDDGGLTVWSHTQGVFPLQGALSEVLALDPDQVRVIHHPGPGCYGHNGADDVALDAALLARAVPGRPVLVTWSRSDEHLWEPWGPAMIVRLSASLDADRLAAFDSENWSYTHTTRPRARDDGTTALLAGWHIEQAMDRPTPAPVRARHVGTHRNSDPLYTIERKRLTSHLSTTTDYRTSALRSLGAFANVFAIESFVDELAVLAGRDAVDFRLANLDDERAVTVIETAAEAGNWSQSRPAGHGRGIGFARYKNLQTYLAAVVDVRVDPATGVIDVVEATLAADAGRIVSPDGVSNQLEGGCVQATSWTLFEEVRLSADGVVSQDWETYPILRFSRSFPVRTVLLDRPDHPSLGCGEAAQGPTAAAIANAVFDAAGIRLRELPLTPDKLLAAFESKPNHRS